LRKIQQRGGHSTGNTKTTGISSLHGEKIDIHTINAEHLKTPFPFNTISSAIYHTEGKNSSVDLNKINTSEEPDSPVNL
jgi:hypothetical protein